MEGKMGSAVAVNTTTSVFQKLRPAVFALIGMLIAVFVVSSARAVKHGAENHSTLQAVPHDSTCFTQGLLYYNNQMFETCGLTGRSSVRMIDPVTGKILKQIKLEHRLFAEGATVVNGLMYVLTWKNRLVIVIDVEQWKIVEEIKIDLTTTGEGWGLTDNGNDLIITDGSDKMIYVSIKVQRDANNVFSGVTLTKKQQLTVTDPSGEKVWALNELEYVNGYVYANVWYKDYIYKIDPHTARVVKKFDFTSLYPAAKRRIERADCLNGIAYNKKDNTFTLTGKFWPQYHTVSL